MEAKFLSGNPQMVDYTPGSAVVAGQVVVVGVNPFVAHSNIAANALGALATGGGEYICTADGALAAGAKVYWDNSANKVTATSSGNKLFGYISPNSSSAADGDEVKVIHRPVN